MAFPFWEAKERANLAWHLYVIADANATTAQCVQRMQYYSSGLPWANNFRANEQPYKYGGKEFV